MASFRWIRAGFSFGLAQVYALARMPSGHHVIRIEVPGHNPIDVYVSSTGRKVRVFRGNVELKENP